MPKTFTVSRYDAAEYLNTPELIEGYLKNAFASGEKAIILKAIGNALRARKNVSQIAKDLKVSRETLRVAFSEKGNPTIDTVMKASKSLGVALTIQAPSPKPKPPRRPAVAVAKAAA